MKLPHEMTSSITEDRRIALLAVRDAELVQGIWIQFVIKLIMEHEKPRALALALILLKKYASSTWNSVVQESKEFQQLAIIMGFLAEKNEPVMAMMAMVILNRTHRFNFNLSLLVPGQRMLPWNVYLENIDNFITYSVIGPQGELVMRHPTTIQAPESFTLENIGIYKEDILREMARNKHLCRHDRVWSDNLFQYILNSSHPLAMALIVAKCEELNVWNDVRARELLNVIYHLLPSWVSLPGFISRFMTLSLSEFNVLNVGGFSPETFPELLMSSTMLSEERCIENSSTLELCLYLGLSLEKVELEQLYPEAKNSFFESIGVVKEEFLHIESHELALSGGSACSRRV